MKKFFYIFTFGIFVLLIVMFIHGVVEMIALEVIFGNPDRFGDTIWWNEWGAIHRVLAYALRIVSFGVGMYLGVKYWEPYGSKPGFFCWLKKKTA